MRTLQNRGAFDDIGRLPAPDVPTPISLDGFERLARHWRSSGVWLSMWDRNGSLVAAADEGLRFWSALRQQSPTFNRRLAQMVIDAVNEPGRPADGPASPRLGPWLPDLGVLAVPVRQRKRPLGAILAAGVLTEHLGEAFDRLCSQCGVDRRVFEGLARKIDPLTTAEMERVLGPLSLAIDQARQIDEAHHAMVDLARNLDNTYEELNLVYRISARMGLPQDRMRMLEHVGQQLVQVSRVRAVGFVLPGYAPPNAPRTDGETAGEDATLDRVVQIGEGAPSLGDLERLCRDLEPGDDRELECSLLNNASAQPGLDWTAGWLKHLVVVPLINNDRRLGVLLAMNCDDGGDFTSVDVQLLRAIADRVTTFIENQRLYDDLSDLLMGLLHALVNSIDAKDPYTSGHSERVAYISKLLARKAGLSPAQCQRVYLAGLLHDVGKIGVPDAILCKPGKLTAQEFVELRKHPEIGVRILSRIRQIQDLMPGVLHHHERMDGRGYPRGLSGTDIPLLGRIICLADCFDAMTTSRTYRAALPLQLAISEIRRCAGTQFDPELAERFLQLDLSAALEDAYAQSGGNPGPGAGADAGIESATWPRPVEQRAWESAAIGTNLKLGVSWEQLSRNTEPSRS